MLSFCRRNIAISALLTDVYLALLCVQNLFALDMLLCWVPFVSSIGILILSLNFHHNRERLARIARRCNCSCHARRAPLCAVEMSQVLMADKAPSPQKEEKKKDVVIHYVHREPRARLHYRVPESAAGDASPDGRLCHEYEFKQTEHQWLALRRTNKFRWHRTADKAYEPPSIVPVPRQPRSRSKSCPPHWKVQSCEDAEADYKAYAKRNWRRVEFALDSPPLDARGRRAR